LPHGVEISKRLALINAAGSALALVLNMTVIVWLQQYLLKRVSTEEYSLLPVLASIMMLGPLLTIVLTSGLSRYITDAYARDDIDRVTQIVSTMFLLLCGAAAALMLCGVLVAWRIERILTIAPAQVLNARLMMFILVSSFAFRLVMLPFGAGLIVRQRFVLDDGIKFVGQILRAALLLVFLSLLGPRVLWVVAATAIADVATLIASRSASMKLVPALRFRRSHVRWALATELVSFGGWAFVSQLGDTIRSSSDPIILNKLATSMDVTCFNLGSLPYQYTQELYIRVRKTLQPALIGMNAKVDAERIRNTYLRIGRYSLWSVLALVVPAIVYRHILISLYVGPRYLVAGTVMAMLLGTQVISRGNTVAEMIAVAKAEIRGLGVRTAVIQLTNLALTLYFVGVMKLGAVGSALGTLTATLVLDPMLMWPLGFRLAATSLREWVKRTAVPGMLPAIASAPVFIVAAAVMRPMSWTALGVCTLLGEMAYGVVLVFCLQPEDRSDLKEALDVIRRQLGRGGGPRRRAH